MAARLFAKKAVVVFCLGPRTETFHFIVAGACACGKKLIDTAEVVTLELQNKSSRVIVYTQVRSSASSSSSTCCWGTLSPTSSRRLRRTVSMSPSSSSSSS